MGVRSSVTEARNALIWEALQGGASVPSVASNYRLSERTVRDIRKRLADRYANEDGKKPSAFGEIGTTGLKHSWGYLQEEFLTELNSSTRRYSVFNEMRQNDPVVGAMLLAIELSSRRVKWYIEGDDQRAEFVESAWGDLEHTWNDHLSEAWTMFPFGWSAFEEVYKRRGGERNDPGSKFSDGKIGWHKFGFRSQDSLHSWDFDARGKLLGMNQQAWTDYTIRYIPAEKLVLYRTTSEKGNPEGRSLLRPAYVPYYYKKNLQAIEAIGAERDLAGLPKIVMPENADTTEGSTDIENAKKIVRRVRMDEEAGLVLPFGWGFELLSAPGSKQVKIDEIITRYEQRIAMSVLAQFIMLGMDKVGSYSLSKDQSDFFVMAVSAFADTLAETFSQSAILRLLRLNGMSTIDPPLLRHGPLGTPDVQAIGQFFASVAQFGFIQPDDELEKWLRGMISAPELTDAILEERKAREEEVKARLAQKAAQQAQAQAAGGASAPAKMSLKAQVKKFSADGKTLRQQIDAIPDKKLRQRILKSSADLTELGEKQLKRGLDALKAITDEEWQQAVKADEEKEKQASGSHPQS